MAQKAASYKEHWGVKFSVVPQGLSEEQVVSYIEDLNSKSKALNEKERHSSLLRLAEQTVVEAEKLATEIKDRARQQAEADAAKARDELISAAKAEAADIIKSAEDDAAERLSDAKGKANEEAKAILTKARREAQGILEEANERVKSVESEMRLEAEFVVRRMTQNIAEGLRRTITDTTNEILPSLDTLVSELRTEFKSEDSGGDSRPRSSSSRSRRS
ncbi:MAG: hypothetical protein FJ317_01940 [SAR202 cluster bacterium]|nr:hypothetical protein [SAR202 cluster bacterium]